MYFLVFRRISSSENRGSCSPTSFSSDECKVHLSIRFKFSGMGFELIIFLISILRNIHSLTITFAVLIIQRNALTGVLIDFLWRKIHENEMVFPVTYIEISCCLLFSLSTFTLIIHILLHIKTRFKINLSHYLWKPLPLDGDKLSRFRILLSGFKSIEGIIKRLSLLSYYVCITKSDNDRLLVCWMWRNASTCHLTLWFFMHDIYLRVSI